MRGRDLGRFSYQTNDWYQIIPNSHYENVETEGDFADKYPLTYSYFKNYEDILVNRSTYKRYQKHLPFYVVYCVGNYTFSPYKVVWMEQQAPQSFRACVVSNYSRSLIPNKMLIPDHKLYFASFEEENEAHYVCGFLNSLPVRTWLGGFLLGKQIGTSVLEYTKIPVYSESNTNCVELSELSKKVHCDRASGLDNSFLGDAEEILVSGYIKRIFS